ncbi:MAG: hypothetical protein B7Y84_19055 [Azorhizobium sp. 32-67-21]|nr:MAG: hypothetical protein B7Y84_19055 [Azorhizobium sp. 32-67-21]
MLPGPAAPGPRDLALAALHVLLDEARASAAGADPADPHSPWGLAAGWRMNRSAFVDLTFAGAGERHVVRAHYVPGGFRLDLPGGTVAAEGTLDPDGGLTARLAGVRLKARVLRSGHKLVIFAAGTECTLDHVDPRFASAAAAGGAGRLVSPMPGTITRVAVAAGDAVKKGDPLVVVEAMKMEHTVAAPRDGTVKSVRYAVGDLVEDGAELLVLEETE